MPTPSTQFNAPLLGLTDTEVTQSRSTHGPNTLYFQPKRQVWHILGEVLREPIFLLLLAGCALYFAIGDTTEAWLMAVSIAFVISIEIVQEFRSEKALEALRQYAQPKVRVRRNGHDGTIPSEELVVGDLILFAEGERLPADATVLQNNDLTVDEAVLTGESLPVAKTAGDNLFQGTVVASGLGAGRVTAVGAATEFGRLGKSIESIEPEPTPLQRQINRFVRQMVLVGLAAFVLVFAINYYYVGTVVAALLFSLSFALALLPEEIPVAFTAFMALGAYRMTRQKILVKQPKTVESLGSATVICLDKTGTITENRMSVAVVEDYGAQGKCLELAMLASEPEPFDAMEVAIHAEYAKHAERDLRPDFQLVHEYPLGGVPPMMTHVQQRGTGEKTERTVAAKGAVERILLVCTGLDDKARAAILNRTHVLASKGYRILGVASAEWKGGQYPDDQDLFPWNFEGLVALYDPPKPNIRGVFEQFYSAGIQVKMITGDYAETALNIAEQSGLNHNGKAVTGEQIMQMNEPELRAAVGANEVFARMFPAAKLRIVEALKANGEVVAMTGDGVNDAPALKSAQIGVAMGARGTEIAKGAASMVLLDDNLERMVTALEMGRRIYNNLRKAIRYVISIHVPIVLVVVLPLVFGWPYLHMLAPIHVIFMELIMDPTCAVAYENEPAEPGLLKKPPRSPDAPLFTGRELGLSIVQGVIITVGIFALYHYAVGQGASEEKTRAFVFSTLLLSNVFLTLVNRSFEFTIIRTLRYPNRSIWIALTAAIAILGAVLFVPWLNSLFKMAPLTWTEIGLCTGTALVSVGWFEVWKGIKPAR
ncbi:MAG: cation-translocating P-type ATPase [Saprospiraceae bacterium]